MRREPLPALPEALRATLPGEVQQYIAALETTVAALEARLGKDSRTSSRPPSSDPPWQTRPPQAPSGRQRGGQPGHEGTSRILLEPEAVDAVAEHWPTRCPACQTALPREAAGAV